MTVLLFNDCYIILKNDDKRRKIRFSTDCNHHCTGRSLYVRRYIRLRGFFSSFSSSLLLSVHLDSSPSASRLFSLSFSFCCSFFILFLLCSFFFTPSFRSLQKTFLFSPFPFCHIGFTRRERTLGQNSHEWGRKYWATCSSVRTAHSFACSALLALLACSAALFLLLARSLCSLPRSWESE